jgi:membrane-bound ClpP family serine protease
MRGKWSFWGFFAHAGIIVGMMVVVFFVIDRFNPAMEFMTSEISKWVILLLAFCAITNGFYTAVLLFLRERRRREKRSARNASPSRQSSARR